MTDEQIERRILDEGFSFTNNPMNAIFVLRNGKLVDGDIHERVRGEDHRMIECLFDDIDRYTPNFWSFVHERTGVVQLVPETEIALKMEGQSLTERQQRTIESCGYRLEDAFPLLQEKKGDSKMKLFDANQMDLALYRDTNGTLLHLAERFVNVEDSILERAASIYDMKDESNVYADIEELPFSRNGYNRYLNEGHYVLENGQTRDHYMVNVALTPNEMDTLINLSKDIGHEIEIGQRRNKENRER